MEESYGKGLTLSGLRRLNSMSYNLYLMVEDTVFKSVLFRWLAGKELCN